MIGYPSGKPDDGRDDTNSRGEVADSPASADGEDRISSPAASSRLHDTDPSGPDASGNSALTAPGQPPGGSTHIPEGFVERDGYLVAEYGHVPVPGEEVRVTWHDDGTCWNPHDTQGRTPESVEAQMRLAGWCVIAGFVIVVVTVALLIW